MDEWVERKDPATGRKYYYNKFLRQTAWHKPEGNAEEANAWIKQIDARTGDVFYFNTITKVRSVVNPVPTPETMTTETPFESQKTLETSPRIPRSQTSVSNEYGSKTMRSGRKSDRKSRAYGATLSSKFGGNAAGNNRASLNQSTGNRRYHSINLGYSDIHQLVQQGAPSEEKFEKLRSLRRNVEEPQRLPEINLDELIRQDKDGGYGQGQYSWENYAGAYFNLKGGMFSKRPNLEEMMSYQIKPLSRALHKMKHPSLEKKAIQAFKCILNFTESQLTDPQIFAAISLLEICAVDSPEELRDEIFCQLIKQQTNNPSPVSLLRTWQLIALCCGSFPPSAAFKPTLDGVIVAFSQTHPNPMNVEERDSKNFAEYARLRLNKCTEVGPRAQVPGTLEVQAALLRRPVEVSVFLVNGTKLDMQAEAWTTVGALRESVGAHLKIKDVSIFAVIEVSDDGSEYVLPIKDRVLDVVSDWEQEYTSYKKPQDAPVNNFIFRVRLFVPIPVADTMAIELAYYQAVVDVTDSRYPVSETDCERLVALHAQEKFGDYAGNDVFGSDDQLRQYLPVRFEGNMDTVRRKILIQYSNLRGLTPFQAMKNYLEYVQNWPSYGCQVFPIEPLNNPGYPKECYIAINARAVFVIDPPTKKFLAEFKWDSIVTWGYSEENFCLVYGNFMQQTKLFFKTNQAIEVYKLVEAYGNRIKGYSAGNSKV